MAIEHRLTYGWNRAGAEPLTKTVSVSGDLEVNADVTVPLSSTDLRITMAIDVSALKSLYITCDKGVKLETNSSSAPDDTLNVAAETPITWHATSGLDCPLTADVTDFYVTRQGSDSATGSATLKIRSNQDGTP